MVISGFLSTCLVALALILLIHWCLLAFFPCRFNGKVQMKTVRLCSYCQKPGHNRQRCPELKKDIEELQAQKLRDKKDSVQKLPSIGSVRKEDIETAVNISAPVTVPVRVS